MDVVPLACKDDLLLDRCYIAATSFLDLMKHLKKSVGGL